MKKKTFDMEAYKNAMFMFPEITYGEYESITDMKIRKEIAKKNKIVSTDSYNRTMTYLR
jgi:hypothetical protein